MKIYSIYILNKAGGLIYQKEIGKNLNRLGADDYLVLASTLHGAHAIASKITPTEIKDAENTLNYRSQANSQLINTGKSQNADANSSGLHSIETDFFNLYVFQSLTGIKFIIITSPNPVVHNVRPLGHVPAISTGELSTQSSSMGTYFREIYILYTDYVMKDPFYSLDMPIKNSIFDNKIMELLQL